MLYKLKLSDWWRQADELLKTEVVLALRTHTASMSYNDTIEAIKADLDVALGVPGVTPTFAFPV